MALPFRNREVTEQLGRVRWGLDVKLAGALLVVAALGMSIGTSTRAAFNSVSDSESNGFTAGSVVIGDNDEGDIMLSLTNAKPGASTSACILVTYTGNLPANVRLYGATTGSGLDAYLNLTVTRGTYGSSTPQFASCTDFVEDATDYLGNGAGVVYRGTLAAFPDDFAGGLVDPVSSSPEEWGPGAMHVYRLTVTLLDDFGAEGKTANQTFLWEARNT
jgi:predicted ribosomally synthesized peptide with SipW-like signal peptide